MPFICKTVTHWITQSVLDPVEQYVSQQQQQCKKRKWPLNWLCWFVTILVKIITWVIRYIVVPVIQVICTFIAWAIFGILGPFLAAIDAVCQRCNFYEIVKDLLFCSAIKFIDKTPAAGGYDYRFNCKCSCFSAQENYITVVAKDDAEAAELAKAVCKKTCG